MTDPTENHARREMPNELPPVEPPSARFIIQLFVIPAAIVLVLVVAYLAFVQLPFGRLANSGRDVTDYVRSIKSDNQERRWRSAYDLASLIHNDAKLAKDPYLLGELTDLLDRELSRSASNKNAKLAEFLALSLGSFLALKSDPVEGRPTDPIAALSRAVGPDQPVEVRVAAAISLSRQADRAGGSFGDPSAVTALAKAAGDGEVEVRQRAAYALGFFSGDESLSALKTRVNEDEDRTVRYNAAAALARRGDVEAAPVLKEMLSPSDLAQTVQRTTPSETQGAIEAIELEALWGLQASAPTRPALAMKVRTEVEALAKSGARNVKVEAQNLLKKLP